MVTGNGIEEILLWRGLWLLVFYFARRRKEWEFGPFNPSQTLDFKYGSLGFLAQWMLWLIDLKWFHQLQLTFFVAKIFNFVSNDLVTNKISH